MSDFKLALVIDAQYDFMNPNGALFVPGSDKVVPILNEYLKSLTLENGYLGVVFTADTHSEEQYPDSLEAKGDPANNIPGFPPHCYIGTDGFKLEVDPKLVTSETKKLILNKSVFNMWEENDLVLRPYAVEGEPKPFGGEQDRDVWFKNILANGVEEVEVTGVAADYCVKWAIEGLVARGFEVTLFDNLTAGIAQDIHQVVKENFASSKVKVL